MALRATEILANDAVTCVQVSTDEQVRGGVSLAMQEGACAMIASFAVD